MSRRKLPDQRKGAQPAAPEIVKLEHQTIEAPPAPLDLLPATLQTWKTYWRSPISDFVQETDLPALERLFELYDEWARTRGALYKEPPPKPEQMPGEPHNAFQIRLSEYNVARQSVGRLIRTDKGLKLNPLLSHMRALEKSIVALEDRFGFTLRSRQELGLNRLRAKTLAEQNVHQLTRTGSTELEEDPRDALSNTTA